MAVNLFAVPFIIPELQTKLDSMDTSIATNLASATTAAALNDATSDGLNTSRTARATWDFATDGGAVSAIGLGVTLPAKSIIEHAYFYTVTQVTAGGSSTGALSCEDANNLYSAASQTETAAGTITEGVADGTTTNFVSNIANACELTWTIASVQASAGKINFFVKYTVAE